MRRIGILAVVLLTVSAMVWAQTAWAARFTAAEMKAALKTDTIEENGFIDNVLAAVDKGILPEDLVTTTFIWAKRKARYKFQYFKRGLIYRAALQGIVIPDDTPQFAPL